MNKKLLELLNKINDQKVLVQNLVSENKLDEAKEAKVKLVEMQDQFDILKDIEDTAVVIEPEAIIAVEPVVDSTKDFANAARMGFRNQMKEGTPADGGYTVPQDIQTRVNEYREAKFSLESLVDKEIVSTNTGARTFKKRSQQTGFTKVAEGGKIAAGATPQFERIEYTIDKYAGALPVTNELLADSDANITAVITQWLGDESRVTRNKLILETLGTQAKTPLKSIDDIKKTLNVTLGQAFKNTSRIITNDDGLQWLDTLKDKDGKYLLQPNPADPMKMRLCAGATTVPVEVIPNADLPTASTKIPFIIGDLKEGVKFFDRNQMTLMSSNTASVGALNAFEMDMVLFRAIEREDCVIKDKAAFVYGEIDTAVAVGM